MRARPRPARVLRRPGAPAAGLVILAVAVATALGGAGPADAAGSTKAGSTKAGSTKAGSTKAGSAAANVLRDTKVAARDRDCLVQALAAVAPAASLDAIARATSIDDLATPIRTTAYAALRRCPNALGAVIVADAASEGLRLTAGDAVCLGTAMAKLTPAQLGEVSGEELSDASPAAQLAFFAAIRSCPAVLGAVFAGEFETQGLAVTPANTRCLSTALARRMSAAQLLDLSVHDPPSRATQLAMFTAFKDCPDAIGPLMAEEITSSLGAAPDPADVACAGRALVNGLTAVELSELANDNLGDRLLTRVLTALGACPEVLVDLIAKGMTESSSTLTDAEARCIVRATLSDFSSAEVVAATTGTPSAALRSRFTNAMARYLQRCAPGKNP
jgi:hypothetical protein